MPKYIAKVCQIGTTNYVDYKGERLTLEEYNLKYKRNIRIPKEVKVCEPKDFVISLPQTPTGVVLVKNKSNGVVTPTLKHGRRAKKDSKEALARFMESEKNGTLERDFPILSTGAKHHHPLPPPFGNACQACLEEASEIVESMRSRAKKDRAPSYDPFTGTWFAEEIDIPNLRRVEPADYVNMRGWLVNPKPVLLKAFLICVALTWVIISSMK